MKMLRVSDRDKSYLLKHIGHWLQSMTLGETASEVWRVPFILAGPGVTPQGRVDTGICELVDTGRTLLALAGLEAPPNYRGRDLLSDPPPPAVYGQIGWPDPQSPLFVRAFKSRVSEVTSQSPPRPARLPAHSQMRAAVRTQRYRLDVTWYRDGERVPLAQADGNLFDLSADPRETRNLWSVPEARPLVHGLWLKLEDWFAGLGCPPELFRNP
jgi:arylsulfatase A-like enzyme